MPDGNFFSGLRGRTNLNLVMQTEVAECALACLTMIAQFHGHELDLAAMRRRFSTSLRGIGLPRMIEVSAELGFTSRALRAEVEYLRDVALPCVLHWDMNHFVVLGGVRKGIADIYDPAKGRYRMPLSEVGKHFTGVLLELTPLPSFQPVEDKQVVSLWTLTAGVKGLGRAAIQVIGIALAIEVLTLCFPFQLQWVLDQVIVTRDYGLLWGICAGFLLALALSNALGLARAWIVSWLGASMTTQWTTNLFAHLLRLPADYFEKRNIGDILSRFSSVTSIQNTLTGTFIEATIDGVMGFLALLILWFYSPSLTCITFGLAIVYGGLRATLYRSLWRVSEEQLVYLARQQSELVESVRGVQAIKLANKAPERTSRLANATVESSIRALRAQRITSGFTVASKFIFGLQRVLLITAAAYFVLKGRFTAGMLVAFITYAEQFSSSIGGLIDKITESKMLRLHIERISDIVLARPESNVESNYSGPELKGRLELRGVGFRYSKGDPWIIRNLSLSIKAGESVALVAPSGFGKSTLAKLISGLLEPEEGTIEIDGIDIRKYGLSSYRHMLGVVMQDDSIFAGRIADNVAFFDPSAKLDDVMAAAKKAELHDEILAMPLGYESAVGDMGSILSGGQKQRLLLARALYRKPKILVLDEATSHLDRQREAAINESIQQLKITRIIIAHRQETINSADRIIDLVSLQT